MAKGPNIIFDLCNRDADRTFVNAAGGNIQVDLEDPPAQAAGVRNWNGWGAALTADQVVGFLVIASGMNVPRCNARMVDWIKGGIVYIWYTLLFAGTSNAQKFGKCVGQCGLTQIWNVPGLLT